MSELIEESPNLLEYQKAADTVRPMSVRAATWVAGLSITPTAIGVGILLAYRLTGADVFTGAGFLWLLGGGSLTFAIGVVALVNLVRAMTRRPRDMPIVWRYLFTLCACFVAVAAAYLCAMLGEQWMNGPHFHLTVTNATQAQIDNVVVHFDNGDVKVGPLSPGQQRRTGLLWLAHKKGPLEITTTAAGQSLRRIDRNPVDEWNLGGHMGGAVDFSVVVEPSELPKAAR